MDSRNHRRKNSPQEPQDRSLLAPGPPPRWKKKRDARLVDRQPSFRRAACRTAERLCYELLPDAAYQARKGNPRLLAEILAFLKPAGKVYLLK